MDNQRIVQSKPTIVSSAVNTESWMLEAPHMHGVYHWQSIALILSH
jgi:hypothetical protein